MLAIDLCEMVRCSFQASDVRECLANFVMKLERRASVKWRKV